MPASTLRPLDAVALAKLHELDPDGRHGVVRRVLLAFESSLSRMVGELALEGAGESADVAVVFNVAHTLKSSSLAVGALELAAACAEVEKRQRGSGAPDRLAADIEHLHREGEAALRTVRSILHS